MTADTLSLTLTFEPLPVTTQKFDFTSPDGLQLLNIHDANSLPEGITNTYWRNETTGDWILEDENMNYNNNFKKKLLFCETEMRYGIFVVSLQP